MTERIPTGVSMPTLIDDPNDGTALTAAQRAKLERWFDESMGTRPEDGALIWLSGPIRCEEKGSG
jgi:hypothetical protein